MSQHRSEPPGRPRWPVSPSDLSVPFNRTQPRQLPRFKVILLRDDTNDLMFIVRTVMELTRLCRAEATHKMWEAHHSGRSVVLVTYLERAELFAQEFTNRNLTVILEPA